MVPAAAAAVLMNGGGLLSAIIGSSTTDLLLNNKPKISGKRKTNGHVSGDECSSTWCTHICILFYTQDKYFQHP